MFLRLVSVGARRASAHSHAAAKSLAHRAIASSAGTRPICTSRATRPVVPTIGFPLTVLRHKKSDSDHSGPQKR
jgi:hypothetical protein